MVTVKIYGIIYLILTTFIFLETATCLTHVLHGTRYIFFQKIHTSVSPTRSSRIRASLATQKAPPYLPLPAVYHHVTTLKVTTLLTSDTKISFACFCTLRNHTACSVSCLAFFSLVRLMLLHVVVLHSHCWVGSPALSFKSYFNSWKVGWKSVLGT